MRYIIILAVVMILSCNSQITKNEKLVNALSDSSLSIRGNIIEAPGYQYQYDYYDVDEIDSHSETLEKMGYQGGGYSWKGIVYGAILISDPEILNDIRFDPEADGLVMWSNHKESLEKIGRLIFIIKSDDNILNDCIIVAKRRFKME